MGKFKIITVILIYCGLYATVTFAQLQAPGKEPNLPDYAKLVPPDKLKEDLNFLFKTIEEVHPNMYAYTPKEEFTQYRNQLYKQIDHPMNRLEFYKLITPVVVLLQFGHLQIEIPKEEFRDYTKSGGKVFPLVLYWDGEKVIVDKNCGDNPVPLGGIIKSIDGNNVVNFIARFAKYRASEQKLGSMRHPGYNLGRFMWLENYPIRPWDSKIKDTKGRVNNYTIGPISWQQFADKAKADSSSNNWSCEYLVEYNTCLLTVNTFGRSLEDFNQFLGQAFKEIRQYEASHLIIDIRKNGGGNSNLGDALLDFLTAKPFRQYELVQQKISQQVGGKNLEKVRNLFSDKSINIDSVVTYEVPLKRPSDNPLRFSGQIFVLIGQASFSAAMDFAAAVRCFNIATLIGQETCDTPVAYGDNYSFNLPNSGLQCRVPYKYFVAACGKPDGRGVLPDYEVKQKPEDTAKGVDTVLQFTLDQIKKSEAKISLK